MTRLFCIVLLSMLPVALGIAQERILSFTSDVTVNKAREILVTEEITVVSEGNNIKRGIFREFPLIYRDDKGKYKVPFEVLSVLKNGEEEPYHTKTAGDNIAIYIGDGDVLLDPGTYTYTLSYKTGRLLGFFDEYDEIYWNVTGNFWRFTIEEASATIHLPDGAEVIQMACYTGPRGSKERECEGKKLDKQTVHFQSNTELYPGHGLTIAVGFTKGVIPAPTPEELESYYINDKKATLVGMIGIFIIFAYYLYAWMRVGKDPQGGAIVPQFTPPENFSPAASRFVSRMGFDNKAFTASIVNMAVKGFIEIDEIKKKKYKLVKVSDDTSLLTSGEKKIAAKLFSYKDEIVLEQKNHSRIRGAIQALQKQLSSEFEKIHFKKNFTWVLPGIIMSIVLLGLIIYFLKDDHDKLGITIGGSVIMIFVSVYLYSLYRAWAHVRTTGWLRAIGRTIPLVLFGIFIYSFSSVMIQEFDITWDKMDYYVPWKIFLIVLGLIFLAIIFYDLMKAPTVYGRKIMDQIEGLKMYLGVAEKHRLDRMNPPEKTPELFEKLLPFAIALNVENAWGEQFDDVLAKASASGDSGGYRPSWYRGRSGYHYTTSNLTSNLGSSLSSNISSSSVSPSSSSGSGGGGSSGGGGGGGGGGGW